MRKKIVRVGSSAAITVSPAELVALGLSVGDPVEVSVHAGVLEAVPVNKYAALPHDDLMRLVNERVGAR